MSKNIIIIDDHAIVRDGLKALLLGYPDYHVLAEAASGAEALQKIKNLAFDFAIVDLRLPDCNGAVLVQDILAIAPNLKCILLTAEPNALDLQRAITAGALGFLSKDIDADDYIKALKTVELGKKYVSQAFGEWLLLDNYQLTLRELEVLQLIADGLPYKQIADKLDISVRTVETHKNNILTKLEVSTPIEMVKKALQLGLIKG